jgi:hypothetical protein
MRVGESTVDTKISTSSAPSRRSFITGKVSVRKPVPSMISGLGWVNEKPWGAVTCVTVGGGTTMSSSSCVAVPPPRFFTSTA